MQLYAIYWAVSINSICLYMSGSAVHYVMSLSGQLTTLFIHTFTTLSHEIYRIQNYTPPVTDVVNMCNIVYS